MYDWELTQYMRDREFKINSKEYIYICNTCPQINHVKYNAWEGKFHMWSDNGCHWSFYVYTE